MQMSQLLLLRWLLRFKFEICHREKLVPKEEGKGCIHTAWKQIHYKVY